MSNFLNQSTIKGDVIVTINDKRPRSPSNELSDSTVSSCEVKRSKKLNYLCGNGQKNWTPTEELVINSVNITKALIKFRNKSIKVAEENNDLNSLRILSLSHVFPVNKFDSSKCTTSYLNEEEAETLKNLANEIKPDIPRSPGNAFLYCKDIVDGVDEGNDVEDDNLLSKMIKDLVTQTVSDKVSISQSSEATFTDKYLMPSIRRVLLSNTGDDVIYAMIDKLDINNKKPDFMLGAKNNNKEFFFFFVEVKRPKIKSKYQDEEDFTKLLKQLKTSIDKQLYLGIENPASLGLLVEGFKCSLFLMTLVADGIYLPLMVKCFSLVEDAHDLIHIPSIVESFSFVKNELHKFMEKINKKKSRNEKKTQKERVRPSFITKFQK